MQVFAKMSRPLRLLVARCRGEHHTRGALRLERGDDRLEQRSSDATPSRMRIDHDVMQQSRRSAQRHPIVPLDRAVRVADHRSVVLGHQHHGLPRSELRAEDLCVSTRRLRTGREETLRIEFVVPCDK